MANATKELPKRSEIPEERKWKLEDIFATDEDWEKELESLKKALPAIEKFQGKIADSPQNLYDVLQLQDQLLERLGKLFTYAHMRYDQDTTNSKYQAMDSKAENVLTKASSSMSYIVPEILEMDEEKLRGFLDEQEDLKLYEHVLDEINRQRPHVLNEREEALLAEASEPMSSASNTFSMLNKADIKFLSIKNENGEEVDLTHGRYIGFLKSKDRDVRKSAFKAMYDTYGEFINTFASTLTGTVKTDNFNAKVRNYDSARQAALDSNNIPEQVYDNLVEAVNEKLPLLHRYMRLRKKVLGMDELHMYDIYTTLVQDADMDIPYEQAKQYVLQGLEPLGDDYVSVLKKVFESRCIDVDENKGKRSGAYSSGAYGTH